MNVERANVASESGYQVTEQKEKNEEENCNSLSMERGTEEIRLVYLRRSKVVAELHL